MWVRADVLLSPHTVALSAHEDDRLVSVFLAQLDRDRRGEQLEHVSLTHRAIAKNQLHGTPCPSQLRPRPRSFSLMRLQF